VKHVSQDIVVSSYFLFHFFFLDPEKMPTADSVAKGAATCTQEDDDAGGAR
jgi:hypothetical protein